MTRLTEAVEQLAADYRKVNATAIAEHDRQPTQERGRYFIQSDRELWEAEEKAKLKGVEIV